MNPSRLLEVMQSQIRTELVPMTPSVHIHAGRFVWEELTRTRFKAPAIFLSCLGWREAPNEVASRFPGQRAYRVRFVAGIVTKSAKSANSRNAEASLLAEALTLLLEAQDWGHELVMEAESASIEPMFIPAAEQDGQSMWLVDWWHTMSFDDESQRHSLEKFLRAYGQHFAASGTHTDANGEDLPTSKDIVTLPHED